MHRGVAFGQGLSRRNGHRCREVIVYGAGRMWEKSSKCFYFLCDIGSRFMGQSNGSNLKGREKV